ncbi:protein TIFY 6b [Typha latifolia]|uniref:protein TIFY 6b n=1 Tax=Typha latifolia TaxID=4733 RepID=UPI003C2CC7AB
MERDFLGLDGKVSGELVKDDGRGSRRDAAFYGGPSAMQWPLSSKVNPLQPFMSFKKVQEETPKRIVSGFQHISSVDAFEANQMSSVLAPERSFSLNGQGVQQNGVHTYQPQSANSYSVSAHRVNGGRMFPMASHHAFPVASGSPFFKVQSAPIPCSTSISSLKQQHFGGGIALNMPVTGSVLGAFASRHVMKPSPSTAQLTIFYAGAVNIFDNVSLDQAQEIMLLASKASNTTLTAGSTRSDPPMTSPAMLPDSHGLNAKQTAILRKNDVALPSSGLSSPLSVPSQSGSLCRSASSSNNDSAGAKSAGPFSPASQQEPPTLPAPLSATTAAIIMPRAVPQARKASLARFFEKRKERVSSVAPYPCIKKSLDYNGLDNVNMPSKSSSTDVTLSNNCDELQCLDQLRNNSSSGESPSTRLEI